LSDPFAEVRFAHIAACDATNHVVGLVRIAGCWYPRSPVPLNELDGGEEGASLVAVRERMVLDKVPAENSRLGFKIGVRLHATETSLRCAQRRLSESDAIEVGDRLGGKSENALGDK
jgi:hypothetical protein